MATDLSEHPPSPLGRHERSERSVAGIVLGFTAVLALVVVVPALILVEPNVGRSAAWPLTFGILILSGLRLAVLIAVGDRKLFEFIFWLFTYVFFGLAPTVQMRTGLMPGTTPGLDPALDMPTAVLSIVGVLAMAAGFLIASRARSRRSIVATPPRDVDLTRLVILTVIGIAGAIYYVSRIGVAILFSSRAQFGAAEAQIWPDPTTTAVFSAIGAFPALIAAHGWWFVASRSERAGWPRTVAIALTALSLLVTNPISSARYHFGVVWGSFLGPAKVYATRLSTSITMIAIVLGLLFLFPVADLFRRQNVVNATRTGFLSEYAGNGDYDAFGQLSNAILYSVSEPFRFGRQFLGVVFFWVPRSIWADKPTDTGTLLAQFRGYSFTNLSAPIWAEMLLSFGVVGVIVLSVLFGFFLGRLDRRLVDSDLTGITGILGSVLPFYLLILMRGSLLQATGILVALVASVLFIRGRPIRAEADR